METEMRKSLLSLIVILSLMLPAAKAAAINYQFDYFKVSTRTFDGGDPTTFFSFAIRDTDSFDTQAVEHVIQSATITGPGDFTQTVASPKLNRWALIEFLGTDDNPRDGTIDPSQSEYDKGINSGFEYEITSTTTPHAAEGYHLDVTCTNGQTLRISRTVAGGSSVAELPPVENVAAGFDADNDNRLKVSWDLPASPYLTTNGIEIRIDRFRADGSPRFIRYRVRNLPSDSISYTLQKWESDAIRLLSPFINVKVRVHADDGASVAESKVKEYAVDGTSLTATVIHPPTTGDINMDGRIGLEEAVNALRVASGIGPLTGEAAVVAAGIAAALDAFNNNDLTTLISYFSTDYLDDGETYEDFQTMIQEERSDPEFQPMTYTISNVVVDGDKATARADFGGGDSDIFTLRKEMDQWKVYGNQLVYEIDLYSTHQTDGHYFAHVMVFDPKDQITSASVSGHGLDNVSLVSRTDNDNDETRWELPDNTPAPDLGTSNPPLYPEYTITVEDESDASPHTIRSSITGHVEEFAGNPTATVNADGSVTFSWTGIPNASGYSFGLGDDNGLLWGDHDISPTSANTYSLNYNPDPSLPPGGYHYNIGSHRESETGYNGSFVGGNFTIPGI